MSRGKQLGLLIAAVAPAFQNPGQDVEAQYSSKVSHCSINMSFRTMM
jgi:hypothetical protein